MEGRDVFISLPKGTGKSLCYPARSITSVYKRVGGGHYTLDCMNGLFHLMHRRSRCLASIIHFVTTFVQYSFNYIKFSKGEFVQELSAIYFQGRKL